MSEDKKPDYLEVDDSIPGQNFVCLSFVSPEALIESKEAFKVGKFLQSYCKDKDMDVNKVMEEYDNFTYKFQDEIQKDFDERNNFRTNIRGLKVRGCYSTKEEATSRAEKLQKIDSDFHVFVGQVGYWLPWDPCADKIEDESFINSQLNDMMEKYKENNINKDIFYEEQKREKVKAAKEEAIRKKKENDELLKKQIEDKSNEEPSNEEPSNEEGVATSKDIQEVANNLTESVIQKTMDNIKGEQNNVTETIEDVDDNNVLDSDLKDSLTEEDPWIRNKMDKEKDA